MTGPAPGRGRSNLGGLVAIWGVALTVFAGYSYYWWQAAETTKAQVRAAMGLGAGMSDAATKDRVRVDGWPFRLTLHVVDPVIAAPGGVALTAAKASASASPFNPSLWVLEGAEAPALVSGDGARQAVTPDGLQGSLRLRPEGLSRLSLTAKGLSIAGAGEKKGWSTGAGALHLVADPADPDTVALSLDVADLTLSEAPEGAGAILGERIGKLRLAGPVTQGRALAQGLKPWAAAGGSVTIMDFELLWGPASVTKGRGALSLDVGGRWNGEASGLGALRPNGVDMPGLSATVSLRVVAGEVRLMGMSAARLPRAFD